MARQRKAKKEEAQPVTDAPAEIPVPTAPPIAEPPPEPPPAEPTPAVRLAAPPTPAGAATRDRIDLGDGREMRLMRSRTDERPKVNRIQFFATREGVDAKPSDEDRRMLVAEGWSYYGSEHAWRKPLAYSDEQHPTARGDSDKKMHEEFVELANAIRERNGLPHVIPSYGAKQEPNGRE
jgi:hypothetical protein